MNFRVVEAKEEKYKEIKNKFISVYEDFYLYAEKLSKEAYAKKQRNVAKKNIISKSGKAGSYARYLIKLIVIYLESTNDIIEKIDSFETLKKLESVRNHTNFTKYNEDEGRFPNATLNCFKAFLVNKETEKNEVIESLIPPDSSTSIEVSDFNNIIYTDSLITQPKIRPLPVTSKWGSIYPRNQNEVNAAKMKNNYTCEIDPTHITFISERTKKNFVEAHHIIPMSAQDYFDYTIDFADNIAILCPNCHRKIHYSCNEDKSALIKLLFNKRKTFYQNYNINIEIEELLSFYNII